MGCGGRRRVSGVGVVDMMARVLFWVMGGVGKH